MFRNILLTLLVAFSTAAYADCNENFFKGARPVLQVQHDKELCFKQYAVLFNTTERIPVLSAEYLTAQDVQGAEKTKRKNAFHIESQLGKASASPSDYHKSGYDMGHMAPSGDMVDADSQYESFSLANMTPQLPALNRIVWKNIEEKVRELATSTGAVYIETGVIVSPKSVLMQDVTVPDAIFKAVYVPSTKQSFVYVGTNTTPSTGTQYTVQEFDKKFGTKVFPALQ